MLNLQASSKYVLVNIGRYIGGFIQVHLHQKFLYFSSRILGLSYKVYVNNLLAFLWENLYNWFPSCTLEIQNAIATVFINPNSFTKKIKMEIWTTIEGFQFLFSRT